MSNGLEVMRAVQGHLMDYFRALAKGQGWEKTRRLINMA